MKVNIGEDAKVEVDKCEEGKKRMCEDGRSEWVML